MNNFIKRRGRLGHPPQPIRRVTLLIILALLSFAARSPTAEAPVVAAELKGKLVKLSGNITVPASDSGIGDPKYYALYFGAGWCGPCHRFTPDLVSFYNEMKPKHPEFEVVFVSHDQSAPEMQQYMAEMHMPWPALRYDAIKWTTELSHLCGPGIPDLVLVDARGNVLSDSFEGAKYLGPQKVLTDLRKILDQRAPAASTAFGSMSPAPAASGTPVSPSGTEWDKIFKKKTP